jgi:hypothetical protein
MKLALVIASLVAVGFALPAIYSGPEKLKGPAQVLNGVILNPKTPQEVSILRQK